VTEPNNRLRDARQRTASPHDPDRPMARQELADLVNTAVHEATGEPGHLDADYVGRLERGVVRWPRQTYRTALKTILNADTDAALGFRTRHAPPPGHGTDLTPHSTATPPAATRESLPSQRTPAPHHVSTLTSETNVPADAGTPADAGLEHLWTTTGLAAAFEEVATVTASPLERRQFLALTGATLAAAAYEWLVADPARIAAALSGRRADAGAIADLTTTVDALRRLDDKLGGEAVHGIVTEQLRLVVRLIRHSSYTEADGQSLYGIAAELARLAGWTSYDAGDHGTAQRYYLVGLRAAHEADAPGIGANILRCMAVQARDVDDPRSAIDLLRSAKAGARGRLTATESAIIEGQLAISYGLIGDRTATRAAADEAYRFIGDADPESDPPYVYWASEHTIAYYAGSSMVWAGDSAAALPQLRAAIDLTGDDLPRDRAIRRARLAIAHVRAGEPDVAVELGHKTLTEMPASPWRRVDDTIRDLSSEIKNAGHAGWKELAEHARYSPISNEI